MKKLLLSVFALTSFVSVNAQCNELFISEYVEGTGNDKAIEIYNPTNSPISLTGYTISRYSNGATTTSNVSPGGGITSLSGTIAAHATFVLVNGQTTGSATSPACSPALQALGNQLDGAYPAPTYFNGNDAMTIEKNGVIVDIFGKIGEDPGTAWTDVAPYTGTTGTWWTKDHTLQRKSSVHQGVTVNPALFDVTAEYDSLPNNTWTGLGTHTCSCPTGINEIDNTISIVVYPNPADNNVFNVSTSESIETIQVYNVVGQQVLTQKGNKGLKSMSVETGNLIKGVYVVKVMFANNKTTVAKLTIK
jgi:predicted extracellular nuclease